MKGKTKRFMSLILSLVLALSMALPASAAGEAIPSIAASATEASVMEAPVDEAPVVEPTAEPVPTVTPVAEETHPAKDRKVSNSKDANEGNYKIKYYLEGLNGGYAENSEAEKACTGTVGVSASVRDGDKKAFVGFTFDESNGNNVLSGAVTEDGGLVLKLYYTRNSYSVTYEYEGTTPASASALPAGGTYKYGAEVSVAGSATADGYTFGGWTSASANIAGGKFTMPAANVEITGALVRDFGSSVGGGKYKFSVANYEGTYDAAKHSVSISGLITGEDYVSFSIDGGSTWTAPAVWNGTIPDSMMFSEVKWNQDKNAGYYYAPDGSVGAAPYSVQVKATNGTASDTKTGTVTINPVELSIRINAATFQFDGNPHGLSDVEGYPEACYGLVEGTALVAGQTLSIASPMALYTYAVGTTAQEKVSLVGTYLGVFIGVISIVDESGNSTLLNYLIAFSAESLVIEGPDFVIKNTLVSTGDDPITVGSLLKYEISVENVTTTAKKNVRIHVAGSVFNEPEGQNGVTVNGSTADIASIAPGGKVVLNAQHEVTQQDIIDYAGKDESGNNKLFKTTMTCWQGGSPNNEQYYAQDIGVDLPDPAPHLTVTVTDTGKGEDYKYKPGEKINYDITVTNDGNVAANLESITDMLPELTITDVPRGIDCTISNLGDISNVTFITAYTLNPGDSVTIRAIYYVTEADVNAGKVINTVTATGKDLDNNAVPVQNGSTEDATEENKPHLTVTVTDTGKGDGYVYKQGEVIDYVITVKNDGNITINLDSVTGAEMIADPGSDFEAVGDTATFDPARTMEPGDTLIIPAKHTVTGADLLIGKVEKTITAAGKDSSDTPVEATGSTEDTTELEVPHLTLTKTTTNKGAGEDGAFKLGEKISYEIKAVNDGTHTVSVEKLEDMLSGVVITSVSGSDCKIDNGLITFDPARNLKPGETITATAEYTVTEADILAGKVVNTAAVSGKDAASGIVEAGGSVEDKTESVKTSFEVAKAVINTPGRGYFAVGETVEFSVIVKNDGNMTQTGVTVKEEMTGAKFTEILENNDGLKITMSDDATLIESIAPGQQITLKAEYAVTQDNLGQKLTNVVSVTGDETECFECAAEIPVDGAVVMTLVKQWDDQNNKFEMRPESVAFILKKTVGKETVEIGKLIASEQNGWTAQSDKLPAHTEDNVEITYTLEEEAVKGYTSSYKVDSMGDTEILQENMSAQDGMSLDENTETWQYTFTNTLNEHTLTIRYLFEDGTVAHKEYKATLAVGEEFAVESPKVQGYDCDIALISDKMADDDMDYTVIYRALNKPVDLGAMIVPLGIGNVSPNAGDCFD